MTALTYLDTHVVVWLYSGHHDLLSDQAAQRVERDDLAVSPMVLLELAYLGEIGRLRAAPSEVLQALHSQLGLRVCGLAFANVVLCALEQSWTRDPFDRLIVGHAAAAKGPLVTRDDTIHANFAGACW